MRVAAGPFATSPLLFFLAFAAAFAVYWWTAVEGRASFTRKQVLVLGLFARICLLPMAPSDDMARYIWEGKVVAAGHDPYSLAPDHADLVQLRDSAWASINHRNIPSVYPPLAMGLFTTLSAWHPSPWLFKAAFILLDMLALAVLLLLLKATPRVAAVYFLNPLLVFESAGSGHHESLPLLFCLLFLGALKRERFLLAALCLALAALSKSTVLVLLPMLILARPWRPGFYLAALVFGPVGLILLMTGSIGTLSGFANDFHYNEAIPFLIRSALGWLVPESVLRPGIRLLFLAGVLFLLPRMRGAPPERQGLAFMGLFLAFAPTVHPWYALWILPFAALSLSRPWLLFTGTAVAAYGAYAAAQVTGRFREIPWLRIPAYLPPAALWLLERLRPGGRP